MLVLVVAAAVAVVPSAGAGGIRDWEPCPDNNGDLVCPLGTTGVPYSIKFRAVQEPPCQPGEDTWHVINDAPPTGLTLAQDGTLSGVPTQAGTFAFWVEYASRTTTIATGRRTPRRSGRHHHPPGRPGSAGSPTADHRAGGRLARDGRDAVHGSDDCQPVGREDLVDRVREPSSGPHARRQRWGDHRASRRCGVYSFTVQALIADGRSDTKALTLEVRDRLAVTGSGDLETRLARTEVGVAFDGGVFASGGLARTPGRSTAISRSALSSLRTAPSAATSEAGTFRFTVSVTDAESRRALYTARVIVAERLAIRSSILKPAKVGRFMSRKVATVGGVAPILTRLKQGRLPKGVFFDRLAGVFVGTPTKAGTWKLRVEVIDSLGVKATRVVVLAVLP